MQADGKRKISYDHTRVLYDNTLTLSTIYILSISLGGLYSNYAYCRKTVSVSIQNMIVCFRNPIKVRCTHNRTGYAAITNIKRYVVLYCKSVRFQYASVNDVFQSNCI